MADDKVPPMSNQADFDLPEGAKPLKTWSYLSGDRRRPSEYEVVSTRLFYNRDDPERPWTIGLNQPLNVWYKKYANGSPLAHDDFEAFRDPDQMTYRAYTVIQDGQESYVDGLLEHNAGLGDDTQYPDDWANILASLYAPGRYLLHTVQMSSSYLFHMAPASTIGICSSFQASDQLRWVSRIAYRTVELANSRPGFGFNENERVHWENDEAWQGFRELMEKVLVAYDWGETFVACNLIAKPVIDETFFRQFGNVARPMATRCWGFWARPRCAIATARAGGRANWSAFSRRRRATRTILTSGSRSGCRSPIRQSTPSAPHCPTASRLPKPPNATPKIFVKVWG